MLLAKIKVGNCKVVIGDHTIVFDLVLRNKYAEKYKKRVTIVARFFLFLLFLCDKITILWVSVRWLKNSKEAKQ